MTAGESRYFNTAEKMDKAFILLLDEKDYEYITIRDICRRAGVNRSTFYLHYENICSLVEETFNNLIKDFLEYYPGHSTKDVIKDIGSGDKDNLVFLTPEYLLPFLNFIKDNSKLFSVVLSEGRVFRHNESYNDLCRYIINPICTLFDVKPEERQYYVHFFIDGIMGIVKEWLKNDCRETPAVLVEIIMKCLQPSRSKSTPLSARNLSVSPCRLTGSHSRLTGRAEPES